ncbi:MAG: type II secretion system F family protein, partial [Phycisphaerales bacterium]|nr:type II secretion system F family protein [Phycisphaerales bacterium]
MPVFAYRAFDATQNVIAGEVTADSGALARQQLRGRGLTVASMAQSRGPSTETKRIAWLERVGAKRREADVAELWRNLATLLDAAIPLTEALQVCLRQQTGRVQSLLRQLHDEVRGGVALSDALRRRPAWFDEMTIAIVRIGEESGGLAAALRELADYLARRRAGAGRLATALIYPCVLMVVGIAVAVFLMSYVIPQLLDVLASAGRPLPRPTLILKSLSDFIAQYGLWLACGLASAAALAWGWARTGSGARRCEKLLLATPRLGDLMRKAWVARFSLMLATMLKAEVRFVAALRTTRAGVASRLLRDELEQLETAVEAGAGIAD